MCPWPEKRTEGKMGIPEKVALNSQLLKASSIFTVLLSHGVPFSLTPGHIPSLLTQAKSLGPLPSSCILFFSSPSTKRSSQNAKSQGKRAERSKQATQSDSCEEQCSQIFCKETTMIRQIRSQNLFI